MTKGCSPGRREGYHCLNTHLCRRHGLCLHFPKRFLGSWLGVGLAWGEGAGALGGNPSRHPSPAWGSLGLRPVASPDLSGRKVHLP